jgi:hypothetical protein
MANVTFSKLNLKKKEEIKTVKFNEQQIEIKQYLLSQDKLDVIYNAISKTEDENRFFNPVKLECYCTLEIIYAYTNIKFTDKQLEDEAKIFDLMEENGLIDTIFSAIPEEETNFIMDSCVESAEAIYKYSNSAYGILEAVKNDSDKLGIDIDQLRAEVSDPEIFGTMKKMRDYDLKTFDI